MRKYLLFIAFASALLSSNLFSEEEEKKPSPPLQHEIVVTANRLETPAKEVASSVTIITREDLERMKKSTVLEVLREALGVAVIQNGGTGGAGSMSIRGANSEHTLIMIDGVELNDPITPSRSYDLAHLVLDSIERIEILRGPQSTLYGSEAIGGVVNIITRRGSGKPRFSLSSYGGSFRTFSTEAGFGGSTEKINYSLGISHLSTQGISASSTAYPGNEEKDGYQNMTLSGRLGFSPLDNLEVDFVLRLINDKADIDNFGGAYGDDPNHTQDYRSLFLKSQLRALLFKNRWEQKLSVSFVYNDRKNENLLDASHPFDSEEGLFKSKRFKVDWQNNLFLHETHTLTLGVDHQQEQGESEYHSEGLWGPYSSLFPLKQASITGLYLQDQIRLAHRFFATVGVRLDSHSLFGSAATYRLAPAYFIEKSGTKLKATFGTGFKSPSLYQLYATATSFGPIGNEDLRPEKSLGWDLGIEQFLLEERVFLGVTYFHNDYKDLIDFDFLQGYLNIGKAESKGAELYLRADPADKLRLRASYTRLEAQDKKTRIPLLRRPKHKFTANISYQFLEKGRLYLSLIHLGKREDLDFSAWPAARATLPGYTLLNASVSYNIKARVQFFFRLDNILDVEYENILGYGTPGFSAFGGLRLDF
ncbi:MAG: TonB-dependent receptor [Candidatus Aminicenantes bacterium]|nr:TonB-dependent receptor [Candidatus Aminicenantes bacterium]